MTITDPFATASPALVACPVCGHEGSLVRGKVGPHLQMRVKGAPYQHPTFWCPGRGEAPEPVSDATPEPSEPEGAEVCARPGCGQRFTPTIRTQRYCTPVCREANDRLRAVGRNAKRRAAA